MRFVPDLPVVSEPREPTGFVSESSRPVQPVGKENTMVVLKEGAKHPPREEHERKGPDRRTYCRRVENHQVIEELRSKVDRRHHKQRKDDPTTNIDEEA